MATVACALSAKTEIHMQAFYVERGLAVTKAVDRGWHVTHLASGYRLSARPFGQRQRARACQLALLGLAVDWTLDEDALLSDAGQVAAIVDVRNQYR